MRNPLERRLALRRDPDRPDAQVIALRIVTDQGDAGAVGPAACQGFEHREHHPARGIFKRAGLGPEAHDPTHDPSFLLKMIRPDTILLAWKADVANNRGWQRAVSRLQTECRLPCDEQPKKGPVQ